MDQVRTHATRPWGVVSENSALERELRRMELLARLETARAARRGAGAQVRIVRGRPTGH
jgi:hypothetical protein